MSDTMLIVNIAIAILGVIGLIVVVKLDPVMSLVIGALYIGLTGGLGAAGTLMAMTEGFGDVMADIGMLIVFGVLIGALLQETGAISRLVDVLLNRFGKRGLPYALGLTVGTGLQSIYLDVLVVISAPLARAASPRLGRFGLARAGSALTLGLYCGLAMMVPGAANIAIAGLLNIPLGKMLLWDLIVIIPTILLSTVIIFTLIKGGFWNPDKDEQEPLPATTPHDGHEIAGGTAGPDQGTHPTESTEDGPQGQSHGATAVAVRAEENARSVPLLVLFLPLLLGLVLIASGSVANAVGDVPTVLELISDPVVALLIGLIGTVGVARYTVGYDRLANAFQRGFGSSGQILILTGVGGSLAGVVTASGLGDVLKDSFTASHVAPLLLVWAIAAVLHAAIGSVTLAALTAAGILAPIAPQLGVEPALIGLAAASGSLFAVHVTANAFWMVQSMLGLTTRGTLKLVTFGVSIASVVSLALVNAFNLII
ncbi:GntP family permease [Rhodococcus koreensis]|uniref:GntP family permease n=1 Tax=Rhodococcus koreensis TaxID=99653 RepID=UPI00197D82CA|nr:SLC13 family permease [Rhodococcus koreensis]QSE86749.1 gluconate permease [Rhodococcus koreensis]